MPRIEPSILGRPQVVRDWTLTPGFAGSNPAAPAMENRNFQKSDMKLKDVWSYQYKAVKLACGGELRIER